MQVRQKVWEQDKNFGLRSTLSKELKQMEQVQSSSIFCLYWANWTKAISMFPFSIITVKWMN